MKGVFMSKRSKYSVEEKLAIINKYYEGNYSINRDFCAEKKNRKWVTDVTEFKYGQQKLYLSAIMDLYDNSLIHSK